MYVRRENSLEHGARASNSCYHWLPDLLHSLIHHLLLHYHTATYLYLHVAKFAPETLATHWATSPVNNVRWISDLVQSDVRPRTQQQLHPEPAGALGPHLSSSIERSSSSSSARNARKATYRRSHWRCRDSDAAAGRVLHWRAPWPASWSSGGSWWVSVAMTRSQQDLADRACWVQPRWCSPCAQNLAAVTISIWTNSVILQAHY
jgi:hypothetical protein